jgi:hypothetical protein
MKLARLIAGVMLVTLLMGQSRPLYPFAPPRGCRDRSCVRSRTGGTAFFEFAPVSGAGMGAACACATPTGANGEAMTFSRASSATCLKTVGTAPQAVANGDMVTCSSGQARVMPGTDGTAINGLLVEASRTNIALQSQAFDNGAVWVASGSVAAAPTVTANAAVAPDGTTTAERVQLPSVSSGWSLIQQTGLGAAGTYSEFVYAKGNGQSGSFIINLGNASCLTCNYTNGVWAQCKQEGRVLAAAVPFSIGQDVSDCGGGPYGSQDFFLWGAQMELGTFASSYIATTSASVTRAAEVADVAISLPTLTALSVADTLILPSTSGNPMLTGALGDGTLGGAAGSTNYFTSQDSAGSALAVTNGAGLPTSYTFGSDATGTASHRYAVFHTGALLNGCVDGVCGAGSAGAFSNPTFTRFRVGAYSSTTQFVNGVTKQVCVDPNPSRCR